MELQPFRQRVSNQVPSTSEISNLAAILAHGRDIANPQNLKFIATQAIALFEECEKARNKRIDMLALYARAESINEQREKLPKPKTFPASLDEVLLLWMPKKRVEDRMKCYRDYIRHCIIERKIMSGGEGENPSNSVEQEAENWFSADKQSGFKSVAFDFASDSFLKWFHGYEAENRRKRAKAMAAGRWSKKNKKTS